MTIAQINWLLARGFSVQQFTYSDRYMLVRGESVILESPADRDLQQWTIKTPTTTLRMSLRACIELALGR